VAVIVPHNFSQKRKCYCTRNCICISTNVEKEIS